MRNLFYDYITQGSRLNKCKDHYMRFSLLFACGEMESKGELEIVEITLKHWLEFSGRKNWIRKRDFEDENFNDICTSFWDKA